MRSLFCAIPLLVILLMSACSSTEIKPVMIEVNEVSESPSCLTEVIGHVALSSWCDAIPNIQAECICGTSLMESRSAVFKSIALKSSSPSNVRGYYKNLDPTSSIEQVEKWMDTSIPLSELKSWVALGLSPGETQGYYDLGVGLSMVNKFLMLDRPLEEIAMWVKTGIDWQYWPHWIQESISPQFALTLTNENDLNTIHKLKKYISNRNFSPVTSEIKPYAWICSRGNLTGQLISVSETHVTYIQRYRLIDNRGYAPPMMTIFRSDLDMDKYIFSSSTLRNKGVSVEWAACPLIVEQQLKDLHAR